MSTKILGNEELNILRAKTPYSLPDNPSDKGFNARQIKTKFWEGYLLLFNWLKETQASLNNDFATTNSALLNESKRIDVILTYFSNGKANFAVRDRNNNIIDETYELKSEASTKFNQLITDIQSVSSASGNKIAGSQNINADGIQYTITLSNTQNATLSTITQYLPLATTLKAGLLSSTDKEKINNIESDLTNFLANAKAYTDEKLQRDNIVNILGAASHTLIGLLTSEDKKKIDALYALLGEKEDADTVVNTINEVLAIFSSYPEGVDIVSQLEKKVNYSDVINTLDSEETSKPLSAKMGKELKTEVDTKAELAYVNEELDKKALKSDILVIDEAVTAQESEITTTQNEGDKLVDEIVGYIDGSPRGVYASLSALQSAFPSGAQGVYVCSDNGHWYYYNNGWKDGGVYQSSEDINAINDTVEMLIDVNDVLLPKKEGQFINGKTIFTSDGGIKDFSGWYCPIKFEVIGGERLYLHPYNLEWQNVNLKIFFYDENNSYISGGGTQNYQVDYGVVVPQNAKYVMYAWYDQKNVGVFNYYLARRGDLTLNKYKNLDLATPKYLHALSEKPSTNLQIMGEYTSKFNEIFKKYEYLKISKSGDVEGIIGFRFYGSFVGDLLVYCPFPIEREFSIYRTTSDKIAVGDRINEHLVVFKNISLDGLYFMSSYFSTANKLTNPTLEFIMCDLNNITNYYLKYLYDKYLEDKKKNSIGKVLYLGDSITYLHQWIPFFEEITNPTKSVNIAVSGATWRDKVGTVYNGTPNSSDETNNVIGNQVEKIIRGKDVNNANYVHVSDYDDFDVIIISAGTNDGIYSDYATIENENTIENQFIVNGNIVNLNDVDRKVFAGAIRYAYEKLHKLYPLAQIFICTPIQENYASLDTYESIKNKGNLIKSICDRLSLTCIDTFKCGICNIYNYPNGVSGSEDIADGIHPNVNGGKKIGRYNAHEILNKLWLVK